MTPQLNGLNLNPAEILNTSLTPATDAFGDLQTLIGSDVLHEYEKQIQWISAEIESTTLQKESLRQDKATLNAMAAKTARDDVTFIPSKAGAEAAKARVITLTPQDWRILEAYAKKLGLSDEFLTQSGTEKGSSQKVVSVKIFDLMQERLDNQLTDLNSTSEMSMIRFQSLTDARKQSLLMLSNMINSDAQTKMAIIQNMKG